MLSGYRVVAEIHPVIQSTDEIGSPKEEIDQQTFITVRGIFYQISAEEKEKFERKLVDAEYIFSANIRADRDWLDERSVVIINNRQYAIVGINRHKLGSFSGVIIFYLKLRS